MGPLDAPREQLDALREGRAFADLSTLRKVRVRGSDATGWLHDLVTTDVATLPQGRSRRSLLLTPTGKIRADFMVGRDDDGYLLLQHEDQPDHIGELLAPYVLSSDVVVADVTDGLDVFGVPGPVAPVIAGPALEPSILGRGVDFVCPAGEASNRVRALLTGHGLAEVEWEGLEVARIRKGEPRMGPDFDQDSLPAEAGLESTIDTSKGCFLGQESVARVRNLGHPPTIVRPVRAEVPIASGRVVLANGAEAAGVVTSAATASDGVGTDAIVRLRWRSRHAALTTEDGVSLTLVGPSD